MAKLVDAVDSKSTSSNRVLVRVRSPARFFPVIRVESYTIQKMYKIEVTVSKVEMSGSV